MRPSHSGSATICPQALKAGSTTEYEWTEASCGTRECTAEIGGIDDETLKDWRAGFEACKNDTIGKRKYEVYATAMKYEFLKSIETGCLKVTVPLTSCDGAVAKLMGITG